MKTLGFLDFGFTIRQICALPYLGDHEIDLPYRTQKGQGVILSLRSAMYDQVILSNHQELLGFHERSRFYPVEVTTMTQNAKANNHQGAALAFSATPSIAANQGFTERLGGAAPAIVESVSLIRCDIEIARDCWKNAVRSPQ